MKKITSLLFATLSISSVQAKVTPVKVTHYNLTGTQCTNEIIPIEQNILQNITSDYSVYLSIPQGTDQKVILSTSPVQGDCVGSQILTFSSDQLGVARFATEKDARFTGGQCDIKDRVTLSQYVSAIISSTFYLDLSAHAVKWRLVSGPEQTMIFAGSLCQKNTKYRVVEFIEAGALSKIVRSNGDKNLAPSSNEDQQVAQLKK